MNSKVQLKFSQVLETVTAVEKMKKDIEELKNMIEEKEKEAGVVIVKKEEKKKSGEADTVMEKTADADAAEGVKMEMENGKEKNITTNEKDMITDSKVAVVDDDAAKKTSKQ